MISDKQESYGTVWSMEWNERTDGDGIRVDRYKTEDTKASLEYGLTVGGLKSPFGNEVEPSSTGTETNFPIWVWRIPPY